MLKRLNLSAPARRTRSLTIIIALAAVCALPWSVTAQSSPTSKSHTVHYKKWHKRFSHSKLAKVTHGVEPTAANTKVSKKNSTQAILVKIQPGAGPAKVTDQKPIVKPFTGLTMIAPVAPEDVKLNGFVMVDPATKARIFTKGGTTWVIPANPQDGAAPTAPQTFTGGGGVAAPAAPQGGFGGGGFGGGMGGGSSAAPVAPQAGVGGGGMGGGGAAAPFAPPAAIGGGGTGWGGGVRITTSGPNHSGLTQVQPAAGGGGFGGGGSGFDTVCEVHVNRGQITARFKNVNLREALSQLFNVAQVDFTIKSDVSYHNLVTCGFNSANIDNVLRAMLDSVEQKLTYHVEGRMYVIFAREGN